MFLLNFNHNCSYLNIMSIYFFKRILIFFNFASVSSLKCIDYNFTNFEMLCKGNDDSSSIFDWLMIEIFGINYLKNCWKKPRFFKKKFRWDFKIVIIFFENDFVRNVNWDLRWNVIWFVSNFCRLFFDVVNVLWIMIHVSKKFSFVKLKISSFWIWHLKLAVIFLFKNLFSNFFI